MQVGGLRQVGAGQGIGALWFRFRLQDFVYRVSTRRGMRRETSRWTLHHWTFTGHAIMGYSIRFAVGQAIARVFGHSDGHSIQHAAGRAVENSIGHAVAHAKGQAVGCADDVPLNI